MRRVRSASAAVLLACAIAAPAAQAGGGSGGSGGSGGQSAENLAFTKHFVMAAAQGNVFEVEGGQLAQAAGSAPVKELGKQLELDHSAAQKDLQAAAASIGITKLPWRPNPLQRWISRELKKTAATSSTSSSTGTTSWTPSAFDVKFLTVGHEGHVMDVLEYASAARETSSPAVRAYACKQLPVLMKHLQMVDALLKQAGIDPGDTPDDYASDATAAGVPDGTDWAAWVAASCSSGSAGSGTSTQAGTTQAGSGQSSSNQSSSGQSTSNQSGQYGSNGNDHRRHCGHRHDDAGSSERQAA